MNTTKEYLLSRYSFLSSVVGVIRGTVEKSFRFLLFKQASICYNKTTRENISSTVLAASRRTFWM